MSINIWERRIAYLSGTDYNTQWSSRGGRMHHFDGMEGYAVADSIFLEDALGSALGSRFSGNVAKGFYVVKPMVVLIAADIVSGPYPTLEEAQAAATILAQVYSES